MDCAADEGVAHALVCAYTIQDKEIDRDGNGASYPKNALVLPSGASITHADDAGVDAEVSMKDDPQPQLHGQQGWRLGQVARSLMTTFVIASGAWQSRRRSRGSREPP